MPCGSFARGKRMAWSWKISASSSSAARSASHGSRPSAKSMIRACARASVDRLGDGIGTRRFWQPARRRPFRRSCAPESQKTLVPTARIRAVNVNRARSDIKHRRSEHFERFFLADPKPSAAALDENQAGLFKTSRDMLVFPSSDPAIPKQSELRAFAPFATIRTRRRFFAFILGGDSNSVILFNFKIIMACFFLFT